MKYEVSRLALISGMAVWFATPIVAQEINNTINETVSTSTADNGAPSDVIITESGNIEFELTDGAIAVRVDSDNSVLNEGDILIEDSDASIGILITADQSGDIINAGRIRLLEEYDREDEDDDDDDDGPLAIGSSRTGISLEAGGVHTGNIVGDFGASIAVEGNQSAGIRLLSDLDGSILLDGSITVLGDDARGLDVQGEVTGDALLSSSIFATGEGAIAVDLSEGVDGALTIESAIQATGFTSTGVSNYVAPANVTDDTDPFEDRRDPDDLLPGGPALVIGGGIGNGLLVNGNIDTFISEEDVDDEIKDTIDDFDENRTRGSLTSVGSAPALLITPDWGDGVTEDLVLGRVVETVRDTLDDDDDDNLAETLAVFDYDQGFINRGGITANGLNVGFDAIAIDISGSDDGVYETIIQGGMLNAGTISASAVEASATALLLGPGARVYQLVNEGSISTSIASQEADRSHGLIIESGATLNSLDNSGTIRASAEGNSSQVTAIWDQSGTLSSITNTGSIEGLYRFDGLETDIREDGIAINVSGSTIDVTFVQREAIALDDVNLDDEIDGDDVADPRVIGKILFGSGNDVLISEFGEIFGDVDFGTGSNQLKLSNTEYSGDVVFSGGAGEVLLGAASSFEGDLTFETGTNTFVLSEGAIFEGDLFSLSNTLDVLVSGSELRLGSATASSLSSLTFDGASVLEVSLDPSSDVTAPLLNVSGVASISSDTRIRPVFTTVSNTDFTRTLISASDIQLESDLDASLLTETRFLYQTDIVLVEASQGDQLDLIYTLKTAEQLGLDRNQAAAYSSVLEVFEGDEDLGFALATVADESEFNQIYNQVLPQRSEASTRYLSSQSSAAYGALSDRLELARLSKGKGWQGWAQEHYTAVDIDDAPDAPGYNGAGFGFSLGFDTSGMGIDTFGLMATFSSGEFEEKTGGQNPVSTSSYGLGVYAQHDVGPLTLRAAGQVAKVNFDSSREIEIIVGEDDNLNIDDALDEEDLLTDINGEWGGLSGSLSLSASTEFRVNSFYARPEVTIDYFGLSQDGYTETAFRYDGLAVDVSSVDTDRLSAVARLAIGAQFNQDEVYDIRWGPELRLGVRTELSSTPYEAVARYTGASESFVIDSTEQYSDALLAGLSLSSASEKFSARLTYDLELMDNGAVHYAGATVSYRF